MTELLPNADKIEVVLDGGAGESTTIPTGKVWVVSIVVEPGAFAEFFSSSGDYTADAIMGADDQVNGLSDLTYHEDVEIQVGGNGAAYISGWEFDYSA